MIVGARRPLIAFNVNLAGANVEAAREIARVVRERDGGFPGVRALGLDLPSAGQAQVSMNVEDWEASRAARDRRGDRARGGGARRRGRGLGARRADAGRRRGRGGRARSLRIDGFDASRLLELRLLGDRRSRS